MAFCSRIVTTLPSDRCHKGESREESGPARGKSDDANREKFKLPLVGGGKWETATLHIGEDAELYCQKSWWWIQFNVDDLVNRISVVSLAQLLNEMA